MRKSRIWQIILHIFIKLIINLSYFKCSEFNCIQSVYIKIVYRLM